MQNPKKPGSDPRRNQDKLQNRLGCAISPIVIWVLLAALALPLLWNLFGQGFGQETEISYSTFRQELVDGNVAQVTLSGQKIRGQLKEAVTKTPEEGPSVEYTEFITYMPSFGDEELLSLLESQDVEVDVEPQAGVSIWTILLSLAPILLLLVFGYFLYGRMRAQGQDMFSVLSMRKSRAKPYDRHKERTTFEDVAGLKGPKNELQEIIAFLKNPERFERLGGEIPKGVLLVGPPGTGKTLLARAVAGEAEVPFFSITGSDFMEMFVGVGASRVRDLFDETKKNAPSIIFIDELDSIGRRRGAGLGGGHDEREQTLNQLLSEMDGFEPNRGVIVMAATNRPDILDPALLRPGRFDRRVTVNMPTRQDRLAILKIHARNKPLADDVDLDRVARGTPGFSGADLENLLNEAALLAARKNQDEIHRSDIEEARDKVLLGLEREDLALTDEECEQLSYHEGGHAVVAAVLPHADPIHKVTIVPRGRAMGVTQQLPEGDRYIYPKEYLMDRLAVMMGGRAAEWLIYGTSTSGAEEDLKQATQLARKMVLDWGMSEQLGHVALGGRNENVFLGEQIAQRRDYSEDTAREVDKEIKSILDEAYRRAVDTLQENREQLERVARTLREKEELTGQEVVDLLGSGRDEEEAPPEREPVPEEVGD